MSSVEQRRKILVTGGAGYVGSHCCKLLAAQNYVPVVYDNFSIGRRDFVKWGFLVEGDIRDAAQLSKAFEKYRPVAVLHFAALALVGESVEHPEKYWDQNVGGTLTLLKAMRDFEVARLVFSSTCAVYGEPAKLPIDEETPKNPVNPYGASKWAAERMMDDFGAAYGLRSLRLRYFNACGADPQGALGEDRDVETHLIPRILDAALGRGDAVKIFGRDYATPDGTAVRDYIHVEDLARAHLKALQYLLADGVTAAVNLGTGSGASVAQVLAAAEAVVGHKILQEEAPRRAGDPASLVADPRRAEVLLGWRAERSDLPTILRDAWGWHLGRFGAQRRFLAGGEG